MWRRLPPSLTSLLRVLLVGGVLLALALLISDNAFYLRLATSAAVLYVLVGGYNIIFGYAGLFSLAQVALAGIGGYAAVIIQAERGANILVASVLAVVLVTVVSVLLAAPTAKLGGAFFALATLAFAVAIHEVTLSWTEVTGGAQGFLGIAPPTIFGQTLLGGKLNFFILAAVVAVLSFEVFYRMSRSATTRKMVALRESMIATQSVGISPIRVRVLAFALSGFFAAISGVLLAYQSLFISPESYSLQMMIEALIVLLIGGAGTLLGPVLGVVALVGIDEASSSLGSSSILVFGVAIVAILSFAPSGLVGIGSKVLRRLNLGRRAQPLAGTAPSVTSATDSRTPTKAGESLVTSGVSLNFAGVQALDDISISVMSGEVVGLIGPNGAGKTSFVNAVTGIVQPSSGVITLSGQSLLGLSAHEISLRGVVRTFQSSKMVPSFDLVTNVMLGRDRLNRATTLEQVLNLRRSRSDDREARRRSLELLALVGVLEHAFERVEDLPYGIVRRAEIARVLATDPSFVLLDEPGAGLSHAERDEVADAIRAVSATGAGVLLIDHNVGFVQAACQRLVVLSNGKLLAEGPTDYVLAHSEVVAAYLGDGSIT